MVRICTRLTWIASVMAALSAPLPAQIALGNQFPLLSAAGLSGGDFSETAGRVVLVDFWASWCAPCKASFPTYSRLQSDYAARGLVVVAVGLDDSLSAYQGFVATLKPSFTTLYDSRRRLVSLVQVPTMPTSYLLDRSGRVRFMHPGFHGDPTEREVRKEIETILGEKSVS